MPTQKSARCGVPGVVVRPEKNGGTKVIRTRGKRWSQESERIFLDELCATCNVTAAAEAAGFSTVAIYNRRKNDVRFAAEWLEAVEQGYARLEALLVERATESLGGVEPVLRQARDERVEDGDERVLGPRLERAPMTVAEAMNLLRLHRSTARGGAPQHYNAREKAPDWDEVSASILRKMDAFDRAEARKAAREKKDALRA